MTDSGFTYAVQTGYGIGRGMRESAANRKIADGFTAYQQALEGDAGGALPVDESPSERLARLQQAEDQFYDGLASAGLPVTEVSQAMQIFSRLKAGYITNQSNAAFSTWGTPAGGEALQRVFESLRPGDVQGVSMQEDAEGNPVYIVEFTNPEDPDGEPFSKALTLEEAQRMFAGLEGGPTALLEYDTRALALNEKYADMERAKSREGRDIESHEAELGVRASQADANTALADSRRASTAYDQSRTGVPVQADLPASFADAQDVLLDYPELDDLARAQPGRFTESYIQVEQYLRGVRQREVSSAEVIEYMESARINAGS